MQFGKEIGLDLALDLEVEVAIENVLSKSKTYFNSVSSIPKNAETTIIINTVVAARKFVILGGTGSSMTDTTFRLYINEVLYETKRTSWSNRNIDFQTKQKVNAGSVIKITAEHNSHLYNVGYAHDIEASLIGIDLPV